MPHPEWNPWLAVGLDNDRASKIHNTFPVYAADLDEDLTLLVGSEVYDVLERLGFTEDEGYEYGSLLVGTADGEYTQVWGCTRSVPHDDSLWYDLLPDEVKND